MDQIRVEPPMMPQNLNGMHVFYSAVALDVLLDRLRAALAGMADTPLVTLKQKSAKVHRCCSLDSRVGLRRPCQAVLVLHKTTRPSCKWQMAVRPLKPILSMFC